MGSAAMEVVDKGEFLVSNAEVKELIQDIRREATAGKYLRPKVVPALQPRTALTHTPCERCAVW